MSFRAKITIEANLLLVEKLRAYSLTSSATTPSLSYSNPVVLEYRHHSEDFLTEGGESI